MNYEPKGTVMKNASEVFGVTPRILDDSYVDRSNLDSIVARQLDRDVHVALRGETKCGKSWLRKKIIPNALVVQCTTGTTIEHIFTGALSQLGIMLETKEISQHSFKGKLSARTELGSRLIKASLGVDAEYEERIQKEKEPVGHDINDALFIINIIKKSERRLVIEDFHYLSPQQRKIMSDFLKLFWDNQLYVVVIGIWSDSNLIITLTPDLATRIIEYSISWSNEDLQKIIDKGCRALNIKFSEEISNRIIHNSYSNAGLLQSITLGYLDELEITHEQEFEIEINDNAKFASSCHKLADQLYALYHNVVRTISSGIRRRPNSTAIYAHAMAVIIESTDEELISGLNVKDIHATACKREERIQLQNLKTALSNLNRLQSDENGRNIILSYSPESGNITIVDKQLLFYRKYNKTAWPWDDLISQYKDSITDEVEID